MFRERKRPARDSDIASSIPESKKARVEKDDPDSGPVTVDVAMDADDEKVVEEDDAATPEEPGLEPETLDPSDGGAFKENPYTFLDPEDPSILTSMLGLHPFSNCMILIIGPKVATLTPAHIPKITRPGSTCPR